MILLKGCARCQGDLFVEEDVGHLDVVCLQCGYRRTIALIWGNSPVAVGQESPDKVRALAESLTGARPSA